MVGRREVDGVLQYRVRWKGYGTDDETWEPETYLQCPQLVREFEDVRSKSATRVLSARGTGGFGRGGRILSRGGGSGPDLVGRTYWGNVCQ